MFLNACFSGLFTVYFCFMFVCHLRQLLVNITTNEMENAFRLSYLHKPVSVDEESGREELHEFVNPFDRGGVVNCVEGFFHPLPPLCLRMEVWGSDGGVRKHPSDMFPDYYSISSVDDIVRVVNAREDRSYAAVALQDVKDS